LERYCLSFLLLGRCWIQSRGEGSVALIEDPQGNPYPEGVEEEKIDPSVSAQVSLSILISVYPRLLFERGRGHSGEQDKRAGV
jgi:hypothetical protein